MNTSHVAALAVVLSFSGGCREKAAPLAGKDPAAPASAPASAGGGVAATPASAVPAQGPTEVPTFVLEPFTPGGTRPRGIFAIEGALAVAEDQRVGRLVGEEVEWLSARIPKGSVALGDNVISSVHGRWPDRIDVVYTSSNGRAPTPTYHPLTGKGSPYTIAPGGGLGLVAGVVSVGESTVFAGYSLGLGDELMTVRGPRLGRRHLTPKQAGCEGDEVPNQADFPRAAVSSGVLAATPDGTMMSFGTLCGKRGPVAEVWDKAGKQRLVDLSPWIKEVTWSAMAVPGKGDELWFVAGDASPILHYQDGKFEPLPGFGGAQLAFLSASGQLYASDGLTIQSHADGKWTPVGRFTWPVQYLRTVAIADAERLWAAAAGRVYRLRRGPRADFHDGCTTPFVFLYKVSGDNPKDFTFPGTRKALATFPGVSEIGLVDFHDGVRRLGVTVTGRAQGEALVAHVKATMKDEDPKLMCYAPKEARRVEIAPPGK